MFEFIPNCLTSFIYVYRLRPKLISSNISVCQCEGERKAAICYEFGKPLVIEEVDLDTLEKGDVKIRMAATALSQAPGHSLSRIYRRE